MALLAWQSGLLPELRAPGADPPLSLRDHVGLWDTLPERMRALVPCAVQGRLGACKGVWLAHPHCHGVHVRRSMVKYSLPHPTTRYGRRDAHLQRTADVRSLADGSQRQLEVRSFSGDGGPGALNRQFIAVLASRGVPPCVLVELAEEELAALRAALAHPAKVLGSCAALCSELDAPGVGRRCCT